MRVQRPKFWEAALNKSLRCLGHVLCRSYGWIWHCEEPAGALFVSTHAILDWRVPNQSCGSPKDETQRAGSLSRQDVYTLPKEISASESRLILRSNFSIPALLRRSGRLLEYRLASSADGREATAIMHEWQVLGVYVSSERVIHSLFGLLRDRLPFKFQSIDSTLLPGGGAARKELQGLASGDQSPGRHPEWGR